MPKRRDINHAEIRDGLRQCGYTVIDTADQGHGFPDMLAVNKKGAIILLEVKMPGAKLTPDEVEFHAMFDGPLYIVRSLEMALDLLAGIERK